MFTPDNAQAVLCRQVPLINDDLAEDTELFLIDLSSTSENVQSGSPIQVTIFDQDSERLINTIFVSVYHLFLFRRC